MAENTRKSSIIFSEVAKGSPRTVSELPASPIQRRIISMPAWLYWATNMGLFDRFKSSTAPMQKGLTAKEWCDRGDTLAKSGRDQEALQCFDRALAIDPKNTTAQQGKPVAVENIRKTGPKQ